MPKDFLQGASLKPTFIQHFKRGELILAIKNSPHDVQTKGRGVKGLLNNVKKKLHFSYGTASLKLTIILFDQPDMAIQLKFFLDFVVCDHFPCPVSKMRHESANMICGSRFSQAK